MLAVGILITADEHELAAHKTDADSEVREKGL